MVHMVSIVPQMTRIRRALFSVSSHLESVNAEIDPANNHPGLVWLETLTRPPDAQSPEDSKRLISKAWQSIPQQRVPEEEIEWR